MHVQFKPIRSGFPAKFARPRNWFDHVIYSSRMESNGMGTMVIICEGFPRTFRALVRPVTMEQFVFVECYVGCVFLVTLGAFERFFNPWLEVNFLEAIRSQVFVRQVL